MTIKHPDTAPLPSVGLSYWGYGGGGFFAWLLPCNYVDIGGAHEMTKQEREAIRERVRQTSREWDCQSKEDQEESLQSYHVRQFRVCSADREALLAEVDRLTGEREGEQQLSNVDIDGY